MNTFEQIYFLIGILSLLVGVGVAFTFVLPVPSQRVKAQSPIYGRLFLVTLWFAFLGICLQPLGFPLASAATLNLCVLLAMYMLYLTVLKRYGQVLTHKQIAMIILHLVFCEALSLYFYLGNNQLLIREMLVSICVLIPLGLTLRLIYQNIPDNRGGDEMIFIVVSLTTIGVVFGVPFYRMWLEPGEPVGTEVAFVAIFMLCLLFMLGFPASLMQSLFIRLSTQAYIDALTGAKNRHYLYRESVRMLAHAQRHEQHFSVVVCDIDFFKKVNDQHGHPAGDEALKQFAHIISDLLRSGDTLVRMGGEEFLIVLPNADIQQASTMAQRLCDEVRDAEIKVENTTLKLTASFGVASLNADDTIFDGIRQADEALYRAKASGRDQVKRAQS
ncbi:GGDEF domain-containing protein [Alteromonas confluentis]|uniref:diguanylate cyclase n=1 Tax=Alteromonas confluentis TaxID=1656094 RepID=A0A1E7Z6X9_9ALTE|nr:GGDEF domain-containing protein [Alteromonas confluentis]OFC69237.1 hypothetical protein BFC18_21230 [Alteromonas confluentis]